MVQRSIFKRLAFGILIGDRGASTASILSDMQDFDSQIYISLLFLVADGLALIEVAVTAARL